MQRILCCFVLHLWHFQRFLVSRENVCSEVLFICRNYAVDVNVDSLVQQFFVKFLDEHVSKVVEKERSDEEDAEPVGEALAWLALLRPVTCAPSNHRVQGAVIKSF